MKVASRQWFFLLLVIVAISPLLAQSATPRDDKQQVPSHQDMMARATKLMGFDQAKVTHHFYLLNNGGAVEITAKDPNDKQTIEAIQKHLQAQAKMWAKGNFDVSAQIHGRIPDGVPLLKKLRDDITYDPRTSDDGAVIRILTVNPRAKESVYEFLRFQINEHQTGDPLQVQAQ